jgi:predicted membrane-bound mannosyltransferase
MDASRALRGQQPLLARVGWRATPLTVAAAAVLLALAVRLNGIALRPLWLDEAYSAWFSTRSWDYLWTAVPTYEPHPPFYYSLLKLWRGLAGGGAVALRSF